MELLRRVNGGEVSINEAAEKLGVDYYVLQYQLNLMDMHGAVNSSSGGSGSGLDDMPPSGLLAKRPSMDISGAGEASSDKRPRVENGGGESAPAAAAESAPAEQAEPATEDAEDATANGSSEAGKAE